jgi:circadian clock protein KaiB
VPKLLLFVRGAGAAGNAAIAALRVLHGQAEVDVVDVFQSPELALRHGVLATPTLVRVEPPAQARFVGNITQQRALECLRQ